MGGNVFLEDNIFKKLQLIQNHCDAALNARLNDKQKIVPVTIGRDIQVLEPKLHPDKKGFSLKEGQARMLHDLASIELQAMELALRTLVEFEQEFQQEEFKNYKNEFQNELYALTLSEAKHLQMCLEGIQSLGYNWGDWPVHTALWDTVSAEDSLLDRILIVHRYLEGSGLDAGDTIIRRLNGVHDWGALKIMKMINFEEIDHVQFGSQWYRKICITNHLDPEYDFKNRIQQLRHKLPKRVERLNLELRKKAGFTESEINVCEELRQSFLIPRSIN